MKLTNGLFSTLFFIGLTLGAVTSTLAETVEKAPRCIVVALPQAVLKHGEVTQDIAAALQNTLAQSLQAHGFSTLSVPTLQPEQLRKHALVSGCDQIALTELKHKKKSRWRKFLSIGLSVGSHHSGGGVGVGISTDLGKSSSGTRAGNFSDNTLDGARQLIHEGDTVAISYQLQRTDQLGVTGKRDFKMKSRFNGENVLQPLAEKVTAAIASDLAN